MDLAVNTTETHGELALFENSNLVTQQRWQRDQSHSEVITKAYLSLMTSVDPKQLKRIFCIVGPGSFTGIRVGVNFVKSLSYSLNLPIYSINTLELLAYRAWGEKTNSVVSVIDAQKNSVFLSHFKKTNQHLQPQSELQVIPIENIAPFIQDDTTYVGQAFERYRNLVDSKFKTKLDVPEKLISSSLSDLWLIPENRFTLNSWETLQPLYIKASSAEEKRNTNLLK